MTAYRGRLLLVGMQIVINLTVDIYQLKITMVPIKWKLHYTNNDDSSAARGPEPNYFLHHIAVVLTGGGSW